MSSLLSLFTSPAYLYRIVAMNTAGSTYSSWQSTNTQQSGMYNVYFQQSACVSSVFFLYSVFYFLPHVAPSDVGNVSLSASTSSTLSLTWSTPDTPNGLITQYYIQAIPVTPVKDHSGMDISLCGIQLKINDLTNALF